MQSVAASRFPFPSHPIGWFCAAFSSEIGVGEVKTFHYFDQDIVLYRTESGAVHAVDAHCPHLGAHLGVGGCVVGETIRCPFHSWRFDGEGRCVEVPYSDKIPPRGNTRGWPICEVNELIFIWHHPTGEPPSWEVPAVETEGWTEDRTVTWELKTHPQEVYENTADVAHLPPIHHVKQSAVVKKPRVEEHLMETDIQFLASGETVGAAGVEVLVHLNVTMRGLGHLISMTHVPEHDIRARQRLFPIPVTRDSIVLRCLVNTKVMPDAAFTAQIAEQMYQAFVFDFARDFPIWENKVYVDRPALAKGDGPIGAYRNWAKRFYLESGNGNGNGAHAVAASPVAPAAAAGAEATGRDESDALLDDWEPPSAEELAELEAHAKPASAEASAELGPDGLPKVRSVAEYIDSLPRRFVPEAAAGLDFVFQWVLTGEDAATFHVVIRESRLTFGDGAHEAPTCTMSMSAADFVQVVNGELSGATVMTTGRGTIAGDIMKAMKMQAILAGTKK